MSVRENTRNFRSGQNVAAKGIDTVRKAFRQCVSAAPE
jgi:hypothetical protein